VLFVSENVPENFTDADSPHEAPRNSGQIRSRPKPTNRLPHQSGMEIS
jgi:hypothetical protein